MSISDPIQLLAFGIAAIISALMIGVQIYARLSRNGINKAVVYPILIGMLIAIFAGLSAFHNKSGEILAWLYSSETIDRGVFEWGTVLCLVTACIFAIKVTKKVKGIQQVLFLGLALVSFFVAGEELSWGQWVFYWGTPDILTEINRQQETNLHNIANPRVYDALYYIMGYTMLGLSFVAFFFFGTAKKSISELKNGLKGLLESGGQWLRGSHVGLVVILSAATLLQHELLEEYAEFVLALVVMLFISHHYKAINKPT
ncbi:MAG: hypothetical protein COA47_08545 [Robiginitomaculum sp.]|nr:MAG: hypothetical protein COA47_08545 [Robiginitomaculum sp.]